LVLKFTNTL